MDLINNFFNDPILRYFFDALGCSAILAFIFFRKDSMLGIIGAFSVLSLVSHLFFLSLYIAILVYGYVSDKTFPLLGVLAAALIVIGPARLLWLFTSKGGGERDGRGWENW